MRRSTITCDKCKRDITKELIMTVDLKNNYEFDFCEKCYGDFLRAFGDWMKDKEEQ